MSLVELAARPEYLGPSISTASRPRNFRGALVNRLNGSFFNLTANTTQAMGFGTVVEEIGGDWYNAAFDPKCLTAPAGVSRVRLFAQVTFVTFTAFVESDNIALFFAKNGAELSGYPLLRITPNESTNRWSLSTLAIPCAPGDNFEVWMRAGANGSDALVVADVDTSFGIEAVTGG